MKKPHILFLSLGGTITMVPTDSGGIAPPLGAAELVASVPELAEVGDIEAHSPFRLPSPSLTPANLVEVASTIMEAFASGFDGAVVIQGTDTIEESAFLLDLLRGFRQAGGDNECDPRRRRAGCGRTRQPFVRGHRRRLPGGARPRNARRSSTTTFTRRVSSRSRTPPCPRRSSRRWSGHRHPHRTAGALLCAGQAQAGPAGWRRPPAPVALLKAAMGDDGRLFGDLPGLGYAGVVIEGMGAGHVHADVSPSSATWRRRSRWCSPAGR